MLQEEQSVTFSPNEIWHPVPWYQSLFVYYLVIVALMMMVKAVRLAWSLHRFRIAARQPASALESISHDRFEYLHDKARSFRNFSHLTLLLSLIVLFWQLCNSLTEVATQRVAGVGAIAGAAADALTTSCAGIIIATVLFCLAMFCERLMRRRKPASVTTPSVP